LKTDLKKCTTFVKKVKSGSIWSVKLDDVTKEIETLNLTRYVEEVAGSVLESKPKATDIPAVVTLCASMHQRYDDFLPSLLPGLWEVVKSPASKSDPEVAKSRRLYVRILTDFLLSGLLPESKPLLRCIAEATGASTAKDDQSYTVQDGNLVVAFCKTAGFEVFGVVPKAVREAQSWFRHQSELLQASSTAEGDGSSEPAGAEKPVLPPRDLVHAGVALSQKVDTIVEDCAAVVPDVSEVLTKHCSGAYDCMVRTVFRLILVLSRTICSVDCIWLIFLSMLCVTGNFPYSDPR